MSAAKLFELPRNPEALPPEKLTDEELADALGEHERLYTLQKPMIDRRKALQDEGQARCESKPPAAETVLEGRIWRTKIGARGWVSVLPALRKIHAMYRAAKKDFYAAASITLTAIERDMGKDKLEEIRTHEQTGYRKITSALKVKPQAN